MPIDLTRPWPELPFVVIDVETTGIDPKRASVCQIAAVRFEHGRVVDRYVTLCKPLERIPEAATAIHGITNEMVEHLYPVHGYAAFIAQVARDALPVAYNEGYDRRIVHRFFDGNDCPAWAMPRWVCPLVIVRDVERVQEGRGYYKLENTCKRWQIPLSQAHTADGDAEATGNLLWAMYERGKIKPCSAEKLVAHVAKRSDAHEAARSW